jgi:hypothetical protein
LQLLVCHLAAIPFLKYRYLPFHKKILMVHYRTFGT